VCLGLALLAGCASTRSSAPIRERAQATPEKSTAAKSLPPVAGGHYRVLPGDTLYKIAFEHGQDPMALAAWNNLADPGRIRSGEILRVIPPPPKATVATTHALPSALQVEAKAPPRPAVTTHGLPAGALVDVTPLAKSLPAKVNTVPVAATSTPSAASDATTVGDDPPDVWSWPVHGTLLARFGDGLNKGIDITAPRGMLVQAAAPGKVVYAGSGLRGYGKLIIIRHGKTLLSAYAHNARVLVTEGQSVMRGQAIGEIGDSDTDRVKLHFEIREFGKPVDPLNYLPNAG
jgi:lipoprotein NlpD